MTETAMTWRKEPPSYAYEMGGEDYCLIKASADYNADKAEASRMLDVPYVEIRMATIYMVWDPQEAERRWREETSDDCECDPHCTEGDPCPAMRPPAESLDEFWDEVGWYCPWREVPGTTPGAVKFRRAEAP